MIPRPLTLTIPYPSDLTCASCRYSAWHKAGLICTKQPRFAIKVCKQFEYEPGTDEKEKYEPCDF
jgi:hypothetical protein